MVSADQPTSVSKQENGTTGWELALVTAPSSNESASAASKLVKPYLKIFAQFSILSVYFLSPHLYEVNHFVILLTSVDGLSE